MEFSSDAQITKIPGLLEELFQHVLYDEEPIFVSDEATIWDVSVSTPDELPGRCSEHFGIPVSVEDFKRPLWKLLPWQRGGKTVLRVVLGAEAGTDEPQPEHLTHRIPAS